MAPYPIQPKSDISDEEITEQFHKLGAWGIASTIDLFRCDPQRIRSAECIQTFVKALCSFIRMRPFGPCTIVRFGEDPRVSGFSMVQLIETSNITAHFIEQTNGACIDIFSCLPYNPAAAAAFCRSYFEAERVNVAYIFRGAVSLEGQILDEQG